MTLHARAYAKINIGLFITGQRVDGYHDIETLFHRVDLFDQLEFEIAKGISIVSNSPEIPPGEGNLCVRAASLLREHLGVDSGVSMTLRKSIPVGAGLGGGSSDAATTLRALTLLWDIPVPDDVLSSLALRLGSDVPYFLKNGSAIARGRGEILEYFPLQLPYAILLCNPGIHISTKWAYGEIRTDSTRTVPDLKAVIRESLASPQKLGIIMHNDFEDTVFNSFPMIKDIKQMMLANGASFASMSGSGATVYGLFREETHARALGARFEERGYSVSITSPMFSP